MPDMAAGAVPIAAAHPQDSKVFPRDLMLFRGSTPPQSLALATVCHEGRPLLALYATHNSLLPPALLQGAVQELGQLLKVGVGGSALRKSGDILSYACLPTAGSVQGGLFVLAMRRTNQDSRMHGFTITPRLPTPLRLVCSMCSAASQGLTPCVPRSVLPQALAPAISEQLQRGPMAAEWRYLHDELLAPGRRTSQVHQSQPHPLPHHYTHAYAHPGSLVLATGSSQSRVSLQRSHLQQQGSGQGQGAASLLGGSVCASGAASPSGVLGSLAGGAADMSSAASRRAKSHDCDRYRGMYGSAGGGRSLASPPGRNGTTGYAGGQLAPTAEHRVISPSELTSAMSAVAATLSSTTTSDLTTVRPSIDTADARLAAFVQGGDGFASPAGTLTGMHTGLMTHGSLRAQQHGAATGRTSFSLEAAGSPRGGVRLAPLISTLHDRLKSAQVRATAGGATVSGQGRVRLAARHSAYLGTPCALTGNNKRAPMPVVEPAEGQGYRYDLSGPALTTSCYKTWYERHFVRLLLPAGRAAHLGQPHRHAAAGPGVAAHPGAGGQGRVRQRVPGAVPRRRGGHQGEGKRRGVGCTPGLCRRP